MKYIRLFFITGAVLLCVLGLGLAGLRLFTPASQLSTTDSNDATPSCAPTLSADTVSENIRNAESGPSENTGTSDTAASENRSLSEDRSASQNDTVSENGLTTDRNTVSDNGLAAENTAVSENALTAARESISDNASVTNDTPEPVPAKDTCAPVFLSFNAAPVIGLGDDFDIHKYIGYGDDTDRLVELTIAGEVDTSVLGDYPLELTLRDDAGHTTHRKLTVTVAEEAPSPSGSNGRREYFADFITRYKTDSTLVGIDVSRWQEDIDFEKVAAAGCEFVYMRIGGLDDGELYTDRYYRKNIENAIAAGLMIGIYWHAEESTPEEVVASVDYLMNVLDGRPLDFPIAYDWEDFLHFENYEMSIHDLNNNLQVFLREVEAHGYTGCLYNSKSYLETVWSDPADYPVWMAHYTSSPTYSGPYFMWQHACTGRIDGINGDVDLDVYYIETEDSF